MEGAFFDLRKFEEWSWLNCSGEPQIQFGIWVRRFEISISEPRTQVSLEAVLDKGANHRAVLQAA